MPEQNDVLNLENLSFLIDNKDPFKNGDLFFRGAIIEESINSPFCRGTIFVEDPTDYRTRVLLDGTESVSFSYKPVDSTLISFPKISLERTVKITDDSEKKLTSAKRVSYGISFVSTSYIISTRSELSKNYNLVSPYQIYRDAFSMVGESIETGSTQPVPISINFKNDRLQKVLGILFDKIDTTGKKFNSCYMMNYYNRGGPVGVKLIDELLTSAPIIDPVFVKYSNQAQIGMKKNSILHHISNIDFHLTKRPYEDYKVCTYNRDTGEVYETNPPVTINFSLPDGRKIYLESAPKGGETKKIIHKIDTSNQNSSTYNFAYAEKHRLVMSTHLEQHKGMFIVPCNNSIKVGKRCKIKIPKRVDDRIQTNSLDDRNSGIVLITGIKHHINIDRMNTNSFMEVEFFKPAYAYT